MAGIGHPYGRRDYVVGGVAVGALVLVVVVGLLVLVGGSDASGRVAGEAARPRTSPSAARGGPVSVRDASQVAALVRHLPGVVDASATSSNLGSLRVDVRLDDGLSAAKAGAAAAGVCRALGGGCGADQASAPGDVTVTLVLGQVSVFAGGADAPAAVADAVADGVTLTAAGAREVRVSVTDPQTKQPAQASVHTDDSRIVALARTARSLDRTVDLSGTVVWYRSHRQADPDLVAYLLAVAGQPGVTSVQYADDDPLSVLADADSGDPVLADLMGWLTHHPYGETPMDYDLQGTRGGKITGTIGKKPAATTLPPFGGGARWPADPSAPSCDLEDLQVTYAGTEGAMGKREATLRARNTSGRACAVDATPSVRFLTSSGAAHLGVVAKPYRNAAATRVVIPAGRSVVSELAWGSMQTDDPADLTRALQVTALPGTAPITLETGADALDVLDGAEVEISPWTQGV